MNESKAERLKHQIDLLNKSLETFSIPQGYFKNIKNELEKLNEACEQINQQVIYAEKSVFVVFENFQQVHDDIEALMKA